MSAGNRALRCSFAYGVVVARGPWSSARAVRMAQLLADASRLFSEAQTAAASGDIATFGAKLQEAIGKVEQAERILAASTTTSTTEPQSDA